MIPRCVSVLESMQAAIVSVLPCIKFCPMVGHKISNSTIESLKKAYIKELHYKRQEGDTEQKALMNFPS